MGEDVKTYGTGRETATLSLAQSIRASVANFRDRFREALGSEPIVEVSPDASTFSITTYGGGTYQEVGKFSIKELPGCCGVAVFYHASTTPRFQKQGLGRLFLQSRERAAILAGYTMAQATVIKSNKGELKLLKEEGWKEIGAFTNKRTKNDILVFFKELGK